MKHPFPIACWMSLAAIAGTAPSAAPAATAQQAAPMRTKWLLTQSSGLDAVAFLGPLSGDPFYTPPYESEIAEFGPRLPADFKGKVATLAADAKAREIMLTPILNLILSGARDTSLDGLIAALADPDRQLRPAYAADPNWDEQQWSWFAGIAPDVRQLLIAMKAAGFEHWWHEKFNPVIARRKPQVEKYLARFDVVGAEERLTGRRFDPTITIVFLHFVKPHGVRVQGQTFLTSFDYPDPIIVSNAAHEMLHPPIAMDGTVAQRLIALVASDPVLRRTISEHDPALGYTTPEGLVNEDLVQALEQATCDMLNCGQSAVYRWNHADEGMHLVAAGIYGIMNERAYPFAPSDFGGWLDQGMTEGWITGEAIRRSAARVLGRPADKLWPVPGSKR